ncbi:unnamed protein product [Cladocopium goreaui]|uniref:Uncharacterized protein n=1 Tax=Cladocopium goreaui TaxID=2562237 RepID=A0A9P1G9F9_9DINO|nr:unnamed protein product [Cladocopium goreaui]
MAFHGECESLWRQTGTRYVRNAAENSFGEFVCKFNRPSSVRPGVKALSAFLESPLPAHLQAKTPEYDPTSFLASKGAHDEHAKQELEALTKKAGHAADNALDYAYNAEIDTTRANEKADLAEIEMENAESWEDYELSLLALLSLVMVGTTGWLYTQYQRWISIKKAMAEHYHGRAL